MGSYESAMDMEKEQERHYRELVEKTENKGLKNIFTLLADEEVRHYNLYKDMKGSDSMRMTDTDIISAVKEVFAQMKGSQEISDMPVSQIDLYK